MKRINSVLVALAAILAANSSIADSIDFNVHSDALRFTYEMDLGKRRGPALAADFGLLYSNDKDRLDGSMAHAGLHVRGENWSETGTFDIRLGGRLMHSSRKGANLSALAPGMQLRYTPIHRVGFGGHIYYAPGILAFQDADEYREYGVRADYQLLPQAFVYVGYRYIDVDVKNVSSAVKLEDNFHLGFKMLF